MEPKKKMTMMQLTVIVAVNMMGSGIIMLPANMAKVGAISLLSWVVTALGSMAIAYGFAQAGLFNQRPGGMSAYAEEAHGKAGFFMTFYLYFFSLAIGNVAIAISAVGYLATFFPLAVVNAGRNLRRGDRADLVDNRGELRRSESDWADRFSDGVGSDSSRWSSFDHRLVLVQR